MRLLDRVLHCSMLLRCPFANCSSHTMLASWLYQSSPCFPLHPHSVLRYDAGDDLEYTHVVKIPYGFCSIFSEHFYSMLQTQVDWPSNVLLVEQWLFGPKRRLSDLSKLSFKCTIMNTW